MSPTSAVPQLVIYKDRPVKMMAAELFDAKSLKCWLFITGKESSFNPLAINPTSGAMGIGQLMPETMRTLGLKVTDNANVQLIGQIAHLSRRHKSVCGAAAYWKKHGNY